MKISQAFKKAVQVTAGQKAGTLKFLAAEGALALMCLAPLLFLVEKGPLKYLAALAVPMWLLVKVPARVNAAAAMQDSLGGGALFSLRLADPGSYWQKVRYGFSRLALLAVWGLPTTAALVFAGAVVSLRTRRRSLPRGIHRGRSAAARRGDLRSSAHPAHAA